MNTEGNRSKRRCQVRPAARWRDLAASFCLLYQAYVDEGLAEPHPLQMRVTPHQLLASSQVFVALDRDFVVATLTLVPDGAWGLPMEDVFGTHVDSLRRRGARVAEVTCLAQHRELASLSYLVRLKGLMAQSALYRGIDQLLIAVHPKHVAYYEDFVGFRVLGGQLACPAVRNRPAVPLALDLKRLRLDSPRAYQRFFGKAFPTEMLAPQPMPHNFVAEFQHLAAPLEREARKVA